MSNDKNTKYWDGPLNKFCRYWFYINKSVEIFNQFKYLFALIFGVYFTLKLTNPIWLLGMIILSIPMLLVFGYFYVHHISKVLEWLNVEFSTHWSRYSFELQENILKELKQLNKKDPTS